MIVILLLAYVLGLIVGSRAVSFEEACAVSFALGLVYVLSSSYDAED